GEEHVAQAAGGPLDQPARQLGRRRMGRTKQRGVGYTFELSANGGIDLRDTMPEQVAPEGGCRVEIAPPAIVDQLVALGGGHDEGLVRGVFGHRGEGMPEMSEVPAPEGLGVRPAHAACAASSRPTSAAKRSKSASAIG